MVRNIVRYGLVALVLGFAACDEAPTEAPDTGGEVVFDPTFDVTGPPDGGTCPDVYYEESELLDNGVTVTWTTVLAGFEYTEGTDYVGTVTWSVDQGTAAFDDFTERRNARRTWTPVGRSGADVVGTMSHVDPVNGSVDVTVNMIPMHQAAEDTDGDDVDDWFGKIGNGHFWLLLDVDDGEDNVESIKLGVNFHLEDPDEGSASNCPS